MKNTRKSDRIVVIGAGPSGLGAGYELKRRGISDWAIFEKNGHVGGLASSVTDPRGFTWDHGGHVLFSKNREFLQVIEEAMGGEFNRLDRDSSIFQNRAFIPYPFQNNIHRLPPEFARECLVGLLNRRNGAGSKGNFKDWILSTFGDGISRQFMIPYNCKVWAYPLNKMDVQWISERVSTVQIESVLENFLRGDSDTGWGGNSTFLFPKGRGMGTLYRRLASRLQDRVFLNRPVRSVDPDRKRVRFSDGREEPYDHLITTAPLTVLVQRMISDCPEGVVRAGRELVNNRGVIVGIGIKKPIQSSRCWVYFPEPGFPFYRVTNFSRYSEEVTPDNRFYSSFLCEISLGKGQVLSDGEAVTRTVRGLIDSGLMDRRDRKRIVSRTVIRLPFSYPIPTLGRDAALETIQGYLRKRNIHSIGRFGAWRYEEGNMDHSFMSGVSTVRTILG